VHTLWAVHCAPLEAVLEVAVSGVLIDIALTCIGDDAFPKVVQFGLVMSGSPRALQASALSLNKISRYIQPSGGSCLERSSSDVSSADGAYM